MASGDNEKTPVTLKQTHPSFKEINNTALGSYTGAKILPFQKGGKKKSASKAAQLVLTETFLSSPRREYFSNHISRIIQLHEKCLSSC